MSYKLSMLPHKTFQEQQTDTYKNARKEGSPLHKACARRAHMEEGPPTVSSELHKSFYSSEAALISQIS